MNIIHDNKPIISVADARALLEKFEEGATTAAEEQSLYTFFRRAELPADLLPLRRLMAWYEGGCVGEPDAPEMPKAKSQRWWNRPIARAAASVAFLLAVGLTLLNTLPSGSAPDDDSYAIAYGGSYVVRNGVKITDPAIVRSEVDRARALTDSINNLIASRTDPDRIIAAALARHVDPHSRVYQAAMATLTNHNNH